MGMVSLTWMPETFVLIGLKSPRTFDGASGLGSQISMWLGPPCRKSMMTDLAAPKALVVDSTLDGAAEACQERNSGRFSPSNPAPPTRSSSRRDQPSQVRTGRPGIVSIDATPWPRLYHPGSGDRIKGTPRMRNLFISALALLLASVAAPAQQYIISTIAGRGQPLYYASALTAAISPLGVAVDTVGAVYFTSNNAVYRLDLNGALTR